MKYNIIRTHEIQTGHRIYGHTGKCKNLHGHSYKIQIKASANKLDNLGMVADFSIIKNTICKWLDDNYDHRMLLWEQDPWALELAKMDTSIQIVPYNPTAENIAQHLLTVVAPQLLVDTAIIINKISIEETTHCRATCKL